VDTAVNHTTQIALNANFEGSDTIFVTKESIIVSSTKHIGYAVTHNQHLVHGTSALIKGERYTLFLCKKRNIKKWLVQKASKELVFYKFICDPNRNQDDTANTLLISHMKHLGKRANKTDTIEFMKKINDMSWDEKSLTNAIDDYWNFMTKAAANPEDALEPDWEVDFIWHTHLQYPLHYRSDLREHFGCYIAHVI
jgi:hypothetical protein